MDKIFLLFLLFPLFTNAQYRLKRVVFLSSGIEAPSYILCGDTDHNGFNEIIFPKGTSTPPYRNVWEIWECYPFNQYELVFADTGPLYPYPPGIHTGNFWTEDMGDIDQDGLTDLLGPNWERANESTYNVVTTQESPDYHSYPESLSWWYRFAYNEVISEPFYFTTDLDNDTKKRDSCWRP